jgi:hypothetical protein
VHLDLPPKRHWRLMSGWCDVGKMAFENLPPRSASLISNACLLNAVRHSDGEEVSESRVRLEIVKLLRFVTRQSIQSLADEVGCTRTHLSLVLSGKRNFTDWMEMRCLDAIQFNQRELSGALEVACCMSYENGLPAPSNAELKNTNRCLYF